MKDKEEEESEMVMFVNGVGHLLIVEEGKRDDVLM
jgi:hypothetical protein